MEDPLDALRPLMASHSPPIHALIVPSEDYHQSEYVSARDKRREFVSGFTGSAGLALITMDEARLWTDGRYFLQATQQLSDRWKLMRIGEDPAVETWIADNLPSDASIGVDPWCISVDTARRWELAFSKTKQKLIQLTANLVDQVWKNRPLLEINPVIVQPLEFAGCSVEKKLKDLRVKLSRENAFAIVIAALDEVAWLYNVRGSDVSYCPVVHSFAIVTADSAFYYVDKRKLSTEVHDHMTKNGIEVRDYGVVESDVATLASGNNEGVDEEKKHNLIWVDPVTGCFALYSKLPSDQVLLQQSPLALAKALKNPVELEGLRKAHIRDGAAVVQYLVWLDMQMQEIYGASGYFLEPEGKNKRKRSKEMAKWGHQTLIRAWRMGRLLQSRWRKRKNGREERGREARGKEDAQSPTCDSGVLQLRLPARRTASPVASTGPRPRETLKLTEVSASDKLEGFRATKEHFKGLSFPTISSVGPNAAVIHYSPDAKTCLELDADSIYLFDSGAQYQDGTTDITRTVHFGKPSAHEKACYTAVLKGHIALDTAKFPNGTTGLSLDILARLPLWKDGLDYRHGTGHGIGSFLNVHEGPHQISFRPSALNVALQPSMTVTDEPGYYEDGSFGIRLENVLIVKEADTKYNFGDKGYLSFEHITWAPYQKKLMDLSLLTTEEVQWVNAYHATCRKVLAPYVDEHEMAWLSRATEAIST